MADGTDPGAEFVEVAGARVRVVTWGSGPVVLCLHGLGGGTHFFGALGPALASSHRVVAVDLPGSGQSPRACRFSFESCAEITIALARRHVGPVHLLGHSMGAIIAIEAIRRAPGLAVSLLAVGGLPEPLAPSRERILARATIARQRGLLGLGPDVVEANFAACTRAEHPALTGLFAALFERQDAEAYAETAEALARWHAPALPPLDAVRCFVLTGAEDRYAPPDAADAFARSLPPGTRVEVTRDCGHLPMLERPGEFARRLEQFLQS
jgi:pimeloyl-ACP methyl ester carboxylesterase